MVSLKNKTDGALPRLPHFFFEKKKQKTLTCIAHTRHAGFFVLLFLALFLTACGSNRVGFAPTGIPLPLSQSENDDTTADIDDDEMEGEAEPIYAPDNATIQYEPVDAILRLSMRQPLTLNPLLNEDVTVARILRLLYEPLIIMDENLRPTSHLAEIEFASDFSSVNLTIRNDAIWSDGMPVTSDDIIFSIETLQNAPQMAIYRNHVRNIASVYRATSRTVQIAFVQPSVTAGYMLNFPIIPAHHDNDMHPVGNGLFQFESIHPMRSLTLVRNPHSFRGRPQIEEIQVLFLPDEQTELYALDQGRIDALHLPLPEWIRHHGVRPLHSEIFPATVFEFIGFNFQRDIFRDLHTRQGIAHAFDATSAVHAVFLDHAVRAASPIHPYSWAADDVHYRAFDQARAYALLGMIRQDARPQEPLVILVNEENPQRVSIATRLAASLNEVGFPAEAEPVPEAEYFQRLENHAFDLFIGGVTLSFAPDMQFLFQSGGLFINDQVLENAFAAMMIASTESAYLQAVSNFQQTFAEHLPVIGLAFRHSAVLTNMRITQNESPMPDHVFFSVGEWVVNLP